MTIREFSRIAIARRVDARIADYVIKTGEPPEPSTIAAWIREEGASVGEELKRIWGGGE